MKKYLLVIICCLFTTTMNAQLFDKAKQLFNNAASSESSMSTLAKEKFNDRYEMTTEREAALNGISWYRKPVISVLNKGKYTGRQIIDLCNKIRNDYPRYNSSKIRNYAADHLNSDAGTLYYCTGTFTVSDKTYKYVKDQAYVLVIPAIKGVLIYEYKNGTYGSVVVCIDGAWQ